MRDLCAKLCADSLAPRNQATTSQEHSCYYLLSWNFSFFFLTSRYFFSFSLFLFFFFFPLSGVCLLLNTGRIVANQLKCEIINQSNCGGIHTEEEPTHTSLPVSSFDASNVEVFAFNILPRKQGCIRR